MNKHTVVAREEWLKARDELLRQEKELTRAHDELAAKRRRMPWELVLNDYEFEGPLGKNKLVDLFNGRSQLIIYHHMLKPADRDPCAGCCMFTDNIGHLAHLHARNTSLSLVSSAPVNEIESFRQRMSWDIPWYSSMDSFSRDFGVTDGFGLNVFLHDNNKIYRTYFTSGRGVEMLGSTWSFLDLTPLGRQETWEDSPKNHPQSPPYQWWRLHDEY